MADNSKIEWCDATWNPILGCDRVSSGCASCYAVQSAWIRQHNPNPKIASAYAGLVEKKSNGKLDWTGRVNLLEDRLFQPHRWKKPRRIFVNSQSDLFHGAVPDRFIDRVFAVMANCPQHVFQVLTKRPERMRQYLSDLKTEKRVATWAGYSTEPSDEVQWRLWPLKNVWLGVSAEDQATADARIPLLLQTPAAVRWVSAEPLLGPIDLKRVRHSLGGKSHFIASVLHGDDGFGLNAARNRIDWVVAGGESGPNARPMHPEWARSLIEQCSIAGVPVFFKQAGSDLARKWGCSNHKGVRMDEWPSDFRVQQYPNQSEKP